MGSHKPPKSSSTPELQQPKNFWVQKINCATKISIVLWRGYKMSYIYKITNKLNNKCYIGQTIKSIEFRFKEHIHRALKHSDHRSHLGAAIRYYGKDAFIIEEIFKVVAYSLETRFVLLDTMECFYIRKFNSRDLNLGYNIQPGG